MTTPAHPPADPPPGVTPIALSFDTDGRMVAITPDGVSVTDPPPDLPQDALDRLAALPDATIQVEGYWE